MSSEPDRFAVRIRQPADAGAERAAELSLMIAPIIGQDADALEAALARDPVVVAQDVSLAEAEQLVGVFESLGATAEVVAPSDDATRPLFGAEAGPEPVAPGWRRVVTKPRERLPEGERRDTRPLETPAPHGPTRTAFGLPRPSLNNPPPPEAGPAATRPLDARAIAAGLVGEGDAPADGTRPFDARALRAALLGEGGPPERPPLGIAPPGEAPPRVLSPAPAPPRLPPLPGRGMGPVTASMGALTPEPALPPPSAGDAPTRRLDAKALPGRGATIGDATQRLRPGVDVPAPDRPADSPATRPLRPGALPGPADVDGTAATRRLGPGDLPGPADVDGEAPTRPLRAGDDLPTVPLEQLDEPTRPFARVDLEAPTGPLPTAPDTRPMDATPTRRRRLTIPHPGVPITRPTPFVTGAPAAPDADTREFVRQRFHAALQTGGFGSAPAGPLTFKLEAPAPLPTETGSMPTPAELGPLTQELAAGAEGGLPELSIEAPARAGVYRLLEHRKTPAEAAPDAPTAPPARPAGAASAGASSPGARSPDAHSPGAHSPSGAFRITRADGSQAMIAPPRRTNPPPSGAPAVPHHPGTAALLGLVLPGMGQAYNGERERGLWFALTAVLILPWLWGVVDAWRGARKIAAGERPAPDPRTRPAALNAQLMVNVAVVVGVVAGYVLWTRLRPPAPPAEAPAALAADPTADADAQIEDAGAPDAARARPPIKTALPIPELMRKGRMACGRGMFAECEEIMHEIVRLDPKNAEAYQLLVEANAKRTQARPRPRPNAGPDDAAP